MKDSDFDYANKVLEKIAGGVRDLFSLAIILTLTSIYLVGAFGLLVIFALLDMLHIKRLTPRRQCQ